MMQRWLNPIIASEMKTRMRGRRAYLIMTLYLMLLSCSIGATYTQFFSDQNQASELYDLVILSVQDGPTIGKIIFAGTVFLLLIVISHIAPAFTATAISGERERQTYEILLITPLKARRIVGGKLGSIFLFLLLLIVTSLPLQSIAFLFGGVAFVELMIATLVLIVTALTFGAFGLYISSLNQKTMPAIIATYSMVLPFIYGLPFAVFMLGSFVLPTVTLFGIADYEWVALIYGIAAVYVGGFFLSINPFSSAGITMAFAANGRGYFFFTENFGYSATGLPLVSPWIVYVIFHSLLTLWFIRLTVRQINKVSDK